MMPLAANVFRVARGTSSDGPNPADQRKTNTPATAGRKQPHPHHCNSVPSRPSQRQCWRRRGPRVVDWLLLHSRGPRWRTTLSSGGQGGDAHSRNAIGAVHIKALDARSRLTCLSTTGSLRLRGGHGSRSVRLLPRHAARSWPSETIHQPSAPLLVRIEAAGTKRTAKGSQRTLRGAQTTHKDPQQVPRGTGVWYARDPPVRALAKSAQSRRRRKQIHSRPET